MAVSEELERLEQLTNTAYNSVNRLFEELAEVLEKKRLEVISDVRRRRTEKRQALEKQREQILVEKSSVAAELTAAKCPSLDLKVRTGGWI